MHLNFYERIVCAAIMSVMAGLLVCHAAPAEEVQGQGPPGPRSFTAVSDNSLKEIEARHAQAESLIARNEFRTAIQKYTEILLMEPDDETAYVNMGHCYLILGDNRRARTSFQNALDIDPENELAREGLDKVNNPDGTMGLIGHEPPEPPLQPAPVSPPTAVSDQKATLAVPESLLKLSFEQEIQTALKNAGFYDGAIDGLMGPASRKAISAFQKSHGLKANGRVGPKTWAVLEPYLAPNKENKA